MPPRLVTTRFANVLCMIIKSAAKMQPDENGAFIGQPSVRK